MTETILKSPSRPLASIVLSMAITLVFLNTSAITYGFQPKVEEKPKAPVDPYAATLAEADKAYRQGNFNKVIEVADGVLSKSAENHTALYLKGSAEIEIGIRTGNLDSVRTGIGNARKAISLLKQLEPNYYMPYLYGMTNLTIMEQQPQHAKVAVEVATQVLKKTSDKLTANQQANILFQRGMARLQLGDFDGTISDYEAALKVNPKHMGVLMAMADAYMAAEKPDDAKATFDRVVTEFPDNALAYNNRGMFLQNTGKSKESIADFTKAVSLEPTMFVALTNRGFAKMNEKNYADAEKDFSLSLTIEPKQPSTHSLRGTARLNQGKSKEAMADYSKVLEFSKKNPLAYADLGFASFFTGDYASSAKAFDNALAIDKNMIYIQPWLYASKILSGDGAGAEKITSTVTKLSAEDRKWPDRLTLYLMGQITPEGLLADLGDDIKDKPEAEKARKCEAYFFIGQRTMNLGETANAKAYFQKAIDTGAEGLSAFRGAQYALKSF